MNKGEYLKAVAEETGLTLKKMTEVYDKQYELTVKALKKGETLQLTGWGTFEARKKAARVGINPQTKKEIKIPARVVPAFKPGKAFKDCFK